MRTAWTILTLAAMLLAGCEDGLGTSLSRNAPLRRQPTDVPQTGETPDMPRSGSTPDMPRSNKPPDMPRSTPHP